MRHFTASWQIWAHGEFGDSNTLKYGTEQQKCVKVSSAKEKIKGELAAGRSRDQVEKDDLREAELLRGSPTYFSITSTLWTPHHLHNMTSSAHSEDLEESLCTGWWLWPSAALHWKNHSVINQCLAQEYFNKPASASSSACHPHMLVTASSYWHEATCDHDGETAPAPL